MPQIYIMAAITLALSVALWGGFLYLLSGRQARWLWLLLPGLPLSAIANLLIKKPLAYLVIETSGEGPGISTASPVWFIAFIALLAPVVEELIKVAPLLIPAIRKAVDGDEAALLTGLGLGIGFGLGEALFLAYSVAQAPEYASYPWWQFTGFLSERLTVTLAHGLITAMTVYGLRRGWWKGLLGYLAAVIAHLAINMGVVLHQLSLIPVEYAGLSLYISLLLLGGVFEALRRKAHESRQAVPSAGEIIYFQRKLDGPE